jgi:hypothetical protein
LSCFFHTLAGIIIGFKRLCCHNLKHDAMIKKSLLVLGLLLPLTIFPQNVIAPLDPAQVNEAVKISELNLSPRVVHPVARQARSRGEQPSAFSGVTYTLQPHVSLMNQAKVNALGQRMPQDGLLDLSGQPPFRPSSDTVYFDPQSDLVFQPIPIDDTQMLVVRPSLSTVFRNIDLPRQVVPVRLANTTFVAMDATGRQMNLSTSGDNESYAINMKFDKTRFELIADKKDSLIILLTGEITLTNPRIEGHYSRSGGYALIFKTSERINLKVESKANFGKETEIPIWGTEIEAGDIGKCKLMLSMVINVEGQISLVAEIDQGLDMALGATGGTYWYVPTSVNRVAEIQHYCDIAYEIKTQLTAFAGVKAATNLSFKGYDVLDLYVKGGMEGTVETAGNDLVADIGYRIKSGGKIVSKKFTLYDQYTSLWKYQTANTAGYKMLVQEACAMGNFVAGNVRDVNGQPYLGNLEIRVRRGNNVSATYQAETNNAGNFLAREIPLRNGDKISIKVPNSPSYSPEVSSTIPFKEISLLSADYYTETATLMVAAAKSDWAQQAGAPSGRIHALAGPQGGPMRPGMPAVSAASHSSLIDRITQLRNSLVTYSGPVTFWLKENENQRARREDVLQGNFAASPLGIGRLTGLNFKPGQLVQARIEMEGFIIISDWVPAEGLMVSALEHLDLTYSSSLPSKSETFSASNSFVVISAIDGRASNPTGWVSLVRGFDAPHSAPERPLTVGDFPEARNALIWFNKTVNLEGLPNNPGASIAQTGPWEASFFYRNPDFLLPLKNGKHPFEKVSYSFKGKELGYSLFIKECHSCSSPANFIENIGNNKLFRDALLQNPGMTPVPQIPAVQPPAGRNLAPGLRR